MTFELSLAYKTALMFPRFEGVVEDHGSRLAVRTPNNPDFMWGNYLLFDRPPEFSDVEVWPRLYESHFGRSPWFMTFGWCNGEVQESVRSGFAAKGFVHESDTVLVMNALVEPKRMHSELTVTPVTDSKTWGLVLDAHIRHLCHGRNREAQIAFEKNRFLTYRRMFEENLGHWFVAWKNGEPVGDMGIFVRDSEARFQEVITYPAYRRSGVCRTLCYHAAKTILGRFGNKTFVTITSEPDARSAYEDIGFKVVGLSQGMRWFDESKRTRD